VGDPLPRGIRGVLFDVGNTLCHNDHAWIAGRLAEAGVDCTPRRVEAAEVLARRRLAAHIAARVRHEDSWGQYFAWVFQDLDVPVDGIPELVEACRTRHAEHGLFRVVRQGTVETLAQLRERGYRVGVVSNAEGNIAGLMDEVGLAPHIEVVIDSAVVGVEKPDPSIWALALEPLGLDAAEAIYVGDVPAVDVEGARRAGLHPLLLDPLDAFGDVSCPRIRCIPDLLDRLPDNTPRETA